MSYGLMSLSNRGNNEAGFRAGLVCLRLCKKNECEQAFRFAD